MVKNRLIGKSTAARAHADAIERVYLELAFILGESQHPMVNRSLPSPAGATARAPRCMNRLLSGFG
jgi:hypothetical protein